MTRHHPLRPALLVLLVLAPACGGAPPPGASTPAGSARRTPNVVIITVDTLRADRVGAYGSESAATPSIDRLAARGVRFERAYAPFPKTNPSLCSLMTGRYPSAHGVRRNGAHLPETELTMAELLDAAGYETVAFISNHVMHSRYGLAQGFRIYNEDLPDPIPTRDSMERTAGSLVDAVLGWARGPERGGGAPLLLWVHFIDPHGPYTPPAFSWPGAGDPEEARSLPVSATNDGLDVIPAYQALPGVSASGEYIARYDAEVEHMDRELGRLLEGLESAGILPGAYVIFAADHGESLGDHGRWFQHGSSLYDPQIRIPMLVSGPGIEPGVRQATVSSIDILPSLLDLLGLQVYGGIQGISLRRTLEERGTEPDERIIHAELERNYAAIRSTEKLIWDSRGGGMELYALDRDPGESTDLSAAGGVSRAVLAAAAGKFARENTRDVPSDESEETLEVLRSLGYVD